MPDDTRPTRLRLIASWLILFGVAAFTAVFLFGAAWDLLHEAWLLDVAREHFAATVGLPFAGLAALVVVVVLEISAGPIQTLAARGVSGLSTMLKVHAERAPLKRNVEPREVGDTALFLCSSLSSGITGETIFVDCGYNIMGI